MIAAVLLAAVCGFMLGFCISDRLPTAKPATFRPPTPGDVYRFDAADPFKDESDDIHVLAVEGGHVAYRRGRGHLVFSRTITGFVSTYDLYKPAKPPAQAAP